MTPEEKAQQLIETFDAIIPKTKYVADQMYRDEGIKKIAFACTEHILMEGYPDVSDERYEYWYEVQRILSIEN